MKYVRFKENNKVKYGVVEGDSIKELNGSFLNASPELTGREVRLEGVRLLSPVKPGKVVCVGLNYAEHIIEMDDFKPDVPKLFMKPSTSVIGPEDDIIWPSMSERVDYEGELAVVIGRALKNASPEEAMEGIFGYTCGNDVTARDLQKKDGQWTRAKSFDTFCPLGPWIVTDIDVSNLKIQSELNGELLQNSSTKFLLVPVPELISFISQVMTLEPGDVVLTGTPKGVGPMKIGDEIVIAIEGIGELKNKIRK
ncbi:MAG: fumarylacetoacetate hydrolase family protein [Eubacteriales bacterium]